MITNLRLAFVSSSSLQPEGVVWRGGPAQVGLAVVGVERVEGGVHRPLLLAALQWLEILLCSGENIFKHQQIYFVTWRAGLRAGLRNCATSLKVNCCTCLFSVTDLAAFSARGSGSLGGGQ